MIRIAAQPSGISRLQTQIFLGYGKNAPTKDESALIDECERELLPLLCYGAVAETYDIVISGTAVDLGFARVTSSSLSRWLSGCRGIYLFASTVGIAPDRLVKKYSELNAAKSAIFQALGGAAEECWCEDVACRIAADAKERGYATVARYSPGYGDLSLDLQKDVCVALSLDKTLGITLTESLLMIPTKSVTAIIGYK